MRRGRVVRAALAAVFALAAAVVPVAVPIAAALPARLGMVSQTPFDVAADGSIVFVLEVPSRIDLAALPGATLVVTAYRPVVSRAEVQAAQQGELPRSVDSVDLVAATVPQPVIGQLAATVLLETTVRTRDALQLSKPGLYPVLLELHHDGEVLADVLTFVHRLPTADEDPEVALPVAVAMTTTAEVRFDDLREVIVTDEIVGELTHLAELLERGSVPVTVHIAPSLLTAVAASSEDGAALIDRLTTALAEHDVLSAPRRPLDPSLAAAAGQGSLYTQWLRDGEDDLAGVLTSPSLRTIVFVDATLSEGGGSLLRDLGARLMVTTPEVFDQLPRSTGIYTDLSQLVQLEVAPGVTLDATVTDRRTGPVLARRTATPTLTTIYTITDLLAYRQEIVDAGGDPRHHGITLGTPDLSLPNTDTYAAITSLLAATPALEPTTLDRLGVQTDHAILNDTEVIVGMPTTVTGDLGARITLVDSLTDEAGSTAGMLADGADRVADWQQRIAILPTSALSDEQVAQMAAELRTELAGIRDAIEVRTGSSFTLTGRTTTVPIKLFNNSDVALTVRVRLSSPKLKFPGGDVIQVLEPQVFTEVPIEMEARSYGTSSATLQILTPDGTTALVAPVTLTARVSALTGMGNLITGALLLVVLTWWARHLRKNRRARHAAKAAVSAERHPATNGRSAAVADSTDPVDDPPAEAATGTGADADAATALSP
ncbi:MAG: hypothetical protein ABMA25_03170, partial [Ilumatobacteraceae bacterium]